MLTEFDLKTEQNNNCVIINTFGYINNEGGQKIVDEFSEYHQNGLNYFVLNLEGTKIVNSIGISFLIEMIEKLNDSNGKLVFINLDPTIEKTFTIMGLFQFAEKASSVEEAINSFN
ncbi:STAS domain protein [bacterium BMS3Abin04]|nr:STAS domain protein [bacterium BMS3Abin04]